MTQPKAIDVKLVEWFDDHWYKVRYINEAKQEVEDYFASVTTKLGALHKGFLAHWRGQVGNVEADRIFMEGCDKGSRIHHAWYTYMNGGAVVFQKDRNPAYTKEEMAEIVKKYKENICVLRRQEDMLDVHKLQRMCQVLKPTPAFNEHTLYDVDEHDAGTTDNIFDIEAGSYMVAGAKALTLPKGRYIFDLKTGKSIDDTARKQVSRYAVMAEKMGLGTISGALIGHTGASTRSGIQGLTVVYLTRKQIIEENEKYLRIARVWDDNFTTAKPKVFQLPALISRTDTVK